MDHHCPWVANCIGFYNYKFFFNMLFYTSNCSLLVCTTAFPLFQGVLSNPNVDYMMAYYIITAYVLDCALCFLISGFMCFHLYLILTGRTTIEYCEKKTEMAFYERGSPYSLGFFKNLQVVLGNNILVWFIPFCKFVLINGW